MIFPTRRRPSAHDTGRICNTVDAGHFGSIEQKGEAAARRPYVTDLLAKGLQDAHHKIRIHAEGPIGFEMDPNHDISQSVTRGTARPGAPWRVFRKARCAWIRLRAPQAVWFNWGSPLCMKYHAPHPLQMTDHKMPRWFPKGLPFGREDSGKAISADGGYDMKRRTFSPCKQNSYWPDCRPYKGFFDIRGSSTYYQASLVAEYSEGTWGFPALRKCFLRFIRREREPPAFSKRAQHHRRESMQFLRG